MVAMFGAVMGSVALPAATLPDQIAGSTIIVIDLAAMGSIDDIRATVGEVVDYVKDTPLADGSSGILYPGEFEALTREQRIEEGVSIADATWGEVSALMDRFGLTEKLAPLATDA
jgi:LDH2 family malate/lactate/ureidoglycolate dehydrogenase